MRPQSSSAQLTAFMSKYAPPVRREAKKALAELRHLLPGAVEFVYDKTNSLVIGFGPNERPSEAIVSIALYSRWVNLYFLEGVILSDPAGLLQGSGNQVRRIKLETADELRRPEVQALIREAAKLAETPIDSGAPRRTIIKQIAKKKRA